MKIKKPIIKRLFFDIETSANVVYTWSVGYKLNIGHENIIKERAVICICYKWEHEKTVHYLKWNKGDDKQMILDFCKIINSADEIVGHNSDKFDTPWFRTRCLFHGVKSLPDFVSVDTLKIARNKFRFNSNRLDYLGKFLGFGGKKDTGGFGLWKAIMETNDKSAMNLMIKYCQRDVILLEKVYNKLKMYSKTKSSEGINCDCPNCGEKNTYLDKYITLATGKKAVTMVCNKGCGKYFRVSEAIYKKSRE